MRWLVCVALFAACTNDPMTEPEDGSVADVERPDSDAGRPDAMPDATPDGMPEPNADLPIEIGTLVIEEGVVGPFTAWSAGDDAVLTWGAQGGIMITPTIRLPTSAGWADGAYTITLAHSADPEHADRFLVDESVRTTTFGADASSCGRGSIRCTEARTIGEHIVFYLLFNQLATTGIYDSYTVLDVTVEGEGRRGTARLPLHLSSVPAPMGCDPFDVRVAGDCRFRIIPGTAHVTRVETTTRRDGSTGIEVDYTFAPTHPNAVMCEPPLAEATTRTWRPTGTCALEVGDEFPMTYEVGLDACSGGSEVIDPSVCSE